MGDTRNCLGCGKPMNVPPSRAARGAGMTCSKECRLDAYGFGQRIRKAMPGTIIGMAEATSVDVAVVRNNVKRLLRAGLAHVSGFNDRGPVTGRGAPRFEAIISLGPQLDPEMPACTRGAVTLHTKRLVLKAMPARAQEIAERLGMQHSSIMRMLEMLRADGLCHIKSWSRPPKGGPVPVFRAGPGKDRPCNIANFTGAEKSARHRAKLIANGEWDAHAAKVRSYYWRNKAKTRRDPMLSALFGPTPTTSTEA